MQKDKKKTVKRHTGLSDIFPYKHPEKRSIISPNTEARFKPNKLDKLSSRVKILSGAQGSTTVTFTDRSSE